MSARYEVYLYAIDDAEETCGHPHATLEEAWNCARWFNPEWPFDVVLVSPDDHIVHVCCREDEDDEDSARRST
jgi:hypothetical protein